MPVRGSPGRRGAVLLSCALPWFATACAAPAAPAVHEHFATATVSVTEQGLQPADAVVLPAFGVVVWRNALPAGAITIEVESAFPLCEQCSTVVNFESVDDHSRSSPVAPQAIASLCFHQAGTFRYVVHTPAGDRPGSVRIGGAP